MAVVEENEMEEKNTKELPRPRPRKNTKLMCPDDIELNNDNNDNNNDSSNNYNAGVSTLEEEQQ